MLWRGGWRSLVLVGANAGLRLLVLKICSRSTMASPSQSRVPLGVLSSILAGAIAATLSNLVVKSVKLLLV